VLFRSQVSKIATAFRLADGVRGLYAQNLAVQRRLSERIGISTNGHAPHAKNCYLWNDPPLDWQVIAAATADAGFSWLSGYEQIIASNWGTTPTAIDRTRTHFVEGSRRPDAQTIVIVGTNWDDKFAFPAGIDGGVRDQPEIEEDLLSRAAIVLAASEPFVASFHPIHAFGDDASYSPRAYSRLIEFANAHGAGVVTIGALADRVSS
jgi:hypothetical protein